MEESNSKKSNRKSTVMKTLIKISISIVLLTYIISKIDKIQLITNIKMLDYLFVPIILVFIILNYIISSYRWKILLIHNKVNDVSVGYLTSLYFIGSFFNNFMPTSIGGDVYKVYKLGKKIGDNAFAFTATFTERFTGVFVLALFSVLSFTGFLKYWVILLVFWFILCVYLGLFVLKILSKKINALKKIYDTLMVYRGQRRMIITVLILAILVQFMSILTQYTIFLALGIKIDYFYALFAFPVITLATFFIPSLNGIGVQDALYMSFFELIGVPKEISLAASVIYHLFRLGVSLIGGILYGLGKSD